MRMHTTAAAVLVAGSALVAAHAVSAQTHSVVVTVDYMKVAPGQDDAYLQVEQKMWKPIHEARVKAGKAIAWYLYRVASPSGTQVEHNYVTVGVYDGFEATENPYPNELVSKIVPAQGVSEFFRKTNASRELVRSEMWEGVPEAFIPAPAGSKPARFLNVAYMKVPPGGAGAYIEVEKWWKKLHEVRTKENTLMNWGVYARMLPEGSDYPYNFAAVSEYANYKDLNGLDIQNAFPKANLGMSLNEFLDRTGKSRDLVRGEIWVLIDSVEAPPSPGATR